MPLALLSLSKMVYCIFGVPVAATVCRNIWRKPDPIALIIAKVSSNRRRVCVYRIHEENKQCIIYATTCERARKLMSILRRFGDVSMGSQNCAQNMIKLLNKPFDETASQQSQQCMIFYWVLFSQH